MELDSPVVQATGVRRVAIDGTRFSIALRLQAILLDPVLGEPGHDGLCTPLGEIHVVGVGVPVIGVTFDTDPTNLWVRSEHSCDLFEDRDR